MFLFFILGFLLSLEPSLAAADLKKTEELYIVDIDWEPYTCFNKKYKPGYCKKIGTFFFHGVWPQNVKLPKKFPAYCRKVDDLTRDFFSLLKPIYSNYKFWNHEWKKHGSCASGISQKEYVGLIKRLHRKIQLPQWSNKVAIVFSAKEIKQSFISKNSFLKEDMMYISCSKNMLKSIAICTDSKGNFIPCPQSIVSTLACPQSNNLIKISIPQ